MKTIASMSAVVVIAAFSLALFLSGCENGGTVALTVSPSFVDLSAGGSNSIQTFTVTDGLRDLSLPLMWSVSDPTVGYIAGSGGDSASYARTSVSNRDNSITVRDQYGAEGVATVRQ